jgi:hypothetical protein
MKHHENTPHYRFILLACIAGLLAKLPAQAQNTTLTYQGRVQSGGSAFNGSRQFKFALVMSTNSNHQARATAVVNGGFITGYTVTDGGRGYLSAPGVTISGGDNFRRRRFGQ